MLPSCAERARVSRDKLLESSSWSLATAEVVVVLVAALLLALAPTVALVGSTSAGVGKCCTCVAGAICSR